jgi:hypothetical protein
VNEALEKLRPPLPPLFVSLNCSHYGYALPLWEKAFEEAGVRPLAFLNPNSRMTDSLFDEKYLNRYPRTAVRGRVVSMVEISRSKVESLGGWLRAVSPEVAEALRHCEWVPDLFEWEEFITR